MPFVVHPTHGRGWMTDQRNSYDRYIVLLEQGARKRFSIKTLYRDPTPPIYPPAAEEIMTLRVDGWHPIIFNINMAWRMIHPLRQRYVFKSIAEMQSLSCIGTVTDKRIETAKLHIPALVGMYRGERYILDGYHRVTKAIRECVTIQYYFLSQAETNYLTEEIDYTPVVEDSDEA
jgi:hypothetical protein